MSSLEEASEPPRVLEELDAQRAASLWDETLNFLEAGKREDEAGNYSSAILLFSEGVDGLKALSSVNKREDVLREYEQIFHDYSKRIRELHELLSSSPQAAAKSVAVGHPVESTSFAQPAASELAQGRLCAELAISADEAGERDADTIALYMTAAEHFLAALKLEDEESSKVQYRAKLTMLLERAESLKNPAPSPPTTVAPSAGGAATTGGLPPQPRGAAAIAAAPAAAAPANAPVAQPPGASSKSAPTLTAEEKGVLARSSKINGVLFYPWLGAR